MSIKESSIREYISNIDFSGDWSIYKMKEDMSKFLGEQPGIDVSYKKDVYLNEATNKAVKVQKLEKIEIIYQDIDDTFKKIEFLISDRV